MSRPEPASTLPTRFVRYRPSLDPSKGGVVTAVLSTSTALAARGVRVTIVTRETPPDTVAELAAAGVDVLELAETPPPPGRTGRARGLAHRARAWAGPVDDADWVSIEGPWDPRSALVALACRRRGVPYIYVPHGGFNILVRQRYPRKHLKKLAWWLLAERHVVAGATTVWCASAYEIGASRATFPGMPRRAAQLGFSAPDLSTPDRGGRDPAAPALRLLTLARIHDIKRLDVLLRALALLAEPRPGQPPGRPVTLTIAGAGDPHVVARLTALAHELGISHLVTWTGQIARSERRALFADADIYCCPGPESFGMSLIEALSAGLPLVVSSEVAIGRQVVDSGAGVQVPYGDPAAFAAGVGELAEAVVAGRVGSRPRRLYEQAFSEASFPERAIGAGLFARP